MNDSRQLFYSNQMVLGTAMSLGSLARKSWTSSAAENVCSVLQLLTRLNPIIRASGAMLDLGLIVICGLRWEVGILLADLLIFYHAVARELLQIW